MGSDGVTNWKAVSPANKAKVAPLVRHYMKDAHPFGACVRDNTKRFGKERAEKICAVVKDMGERTTKWRKGRGKKVQESAADESAFIAGLFDEVMAPVLEAERVTVGELAAWSTMAVAAGVLESDRFKLEVTPDLLAGAARRVSEAAAPAAESKAKRKAGESLSDYGKRLKGRDAQIERGRDAAKKKGKTTRAGKNADFEKEHPRGRGGSWTLKAGGAKQDEDAVRAVQRKVGAKDDGKFGGQTKAKIRAFQKANGLQVDGIVGRQTAAALLGRKGAKDMKAGQATAGDLVKLASRGKKKAKGDRKVREAAIAALPDVEITPEALAALK